MSLKTSLSGFAHLFFPHICRGCGSNIPRHKMLCSWCTYRLPHTGFALIENNPVERIFTGRIPVRSAHSEFYFSKNEIVQQLIHLLKYKGDKEIGKFLGECIGKSISVSPRFRDIDYLVPLPLYKDKLFRRGYNQAEVICEGISNITNIPVLGKTVIRQRETETQTKKHRTDRWLNVSGSFIVKDENLLTGKHILLVDDVITTGATLEACGQAIIQIPGTTLSIAALAHASK